MLVISYAFAILYLIAGALWWRAIVLPGPAQGEPEDWRADLAQANTRGDIAFLIAKGTFVLLWPLVLGGAWLAARAE